MKISGRNDQGRGQHQDVGNVGSWRSAGCGLPRAPCLPAEWNNMHADERTQKYAR